MKIAKVTVALGFAACLLLAGCKGEPEMTKKEEENFKGGPPPAGFFDKEENKPKPGN